MDIIQKFLPYINVPNPSIRNEPELMIAKKYADLTDELAKAKLSAISGATIGKNGAVMVKPSQEIADLDERIERLQSIANDMGQILDGCGVGSIHDLRETKTAHQNTVGSNPFRAWEAFIHARGEGQVIPEKMRIYWLPSDIAQVPEYKAEEDRLRSEIEAAKIALEPINAALARLDALTAEVDVI